MRPAKGLFDPSLGFGLDVRQLKDELWSRGSRYMRRRQLLAFKLGHYVYQLRVHHLDREDLDQNPHNHPFDFWSWLFGSYIEADQHGQWVRRRRWSLAYRSAEVFHRITWVQPGTWSLVFVRFGMHKHSGDWGFLVDGEFIPHGRYFDLQELKK